jgi:hypothetical protein
VAPDLDAQLPDVDGPDWVRSLDAVLALPRVTALFDAHGTVLLGEEVVRAALAEKREFLGAIERRVREHLDGASTLEELTARVFAPRGGLEEWLAQGDGRLSLLTGSDFSRRHLVASFARLAPRRGCRIAAARRPLSASSQRRKHHRKTA